MTGSVIASIKDHRHDRLEGVHALGQADPLGLRLLEKKISNQCPARWQGCAQISYASAYWDERKKTPFTYTQRLSMYVTAWKTCSNMCKQNVRVCDLQMFAQKRSQ